MLVRVDGLAFRKAIEGKTGAKVIHLTAGQSEVLDCLDIEMTDYISIAIVEYSR